MAPAPDRAGVHEPLARRLQRLLRAIRCSRRSTFSFTHYDLLQPARWIGLANYEYMFSDDPQIWPAV